MTNRAENVTAADMMSAAPRPVEHGAQRQHDDEDRALRSYLPVRRYVHEGQEGTGQRQRHGPEHGSDRVDPAAGELAAAQDHAGDRQQRVAKRHVGVARRRQPHQRQPRQGAQRSRHQVQRHARPQQRPAGIRQRLRVPAGSAQDRTEGGAHQQVHPQSQDHGVEDRQRDEIGLPLHHGGQELRRPSSGGRQDQHGQPHPDERQPQRHDDGRQRPPVDQCSDQTVDADGGDQRRDAQQGSVLEQRCGDAGAQSHEAADAQVQIVDRDDAELRQRRQDHRHREVEQQGQPDIAHGARLLREDHRQHQRQGYCRQQHPQQADGVEAGRAARGQGCGGHATSPDASA
jgi:hypothetical protein